MLSALCHIVPIAMARANFSSGGNAGPALSPGLRVGGARFLLKRLVGRGETTEVWLARDVKAMRDVALKFLPPAFLSDDTLVERFKEQCQRNLLLRHPHIVSTHEFVRDYDSAAIAMEFVDGWSLSTLKVDKLCRCYSIDEIEPWVRQTGEALEYAQAEFGLVHGDLKPANLLVSMREGIKISDFGFAALIRSESSRRGLVKGGCGGIGFLSPQQVMGSAPSKLDDIYSFGATIFDLLTGTPPFYQGEVIAQVCGLKSPGMTQRLEELEIQGDPISPVWEDVVAACLAKNPADRPQSLGEVLQLLQRTEVSLPAASTAEPEVAGVVEVAIPDEEIITPEADAAVLPAEVAPASPVGPHRLRAALISVLVVLGIVGLAAGFWFARGGRPGATWLSIFNVRSAANPSGLLDTNFNVGSGANDSIHCLVLQPDGKILLGGLFSSFNGVPDRHILRLSPDGRLDVPFAMQPPGRVHALALQSDGKILMAGETMLDKRPLTHVVRLNAAGQREGGWGLHTTLNAEIRTLAIQPDGRIVAGGSFTSVSGNNLRRLMRLNGNGTVDNGFDIGDGASGTVWSVAIQPDGKILAAGSFDRFHGQEAGHLVRLNPDGSPDPGFKNKPGTDGDILAVALQKDGKILIGGKFATVDGLACPHVARLNPDGRVDTSFNPGSDLNESIQCIALQPDGKIIMGGGFDRIQGETRHGVARLNPDGRLDKGFNVGEGASGYVWSVTVQPDGKIVVAGAFQAFGGRPGGRIVRLLN
jgi:uncharacterized delta-60 repeat protein